MGILNGFLHGAVLHRKCPVMLCKTYGILRDGAHEQFTGNITVKQKLVGDQCLQILFRHPRDQRPVMVFAPRPAYFEEVLQKLEKMQ